MTTSLSPGVATELLKLMLQLAWSDHELVDAERAYIRGLAHRLGLDPQRDGDLEGWIAGTLPLSAPDLGVLKSEAESVMRAAAGVIVADGVVVDDERAMVRQIVDILSR